MTNTSEKYVSVNALVDRDINNTKFEVYQIQANTHQNIIKILNVGKFNEIPVVPILAVVMHGFNCEMLSFLVTEDEINDETRLKMIGFLIQSENKVLASLDFVFKPASKIALLPAPMNDTSGIFEIVLTRMSHGTKVTETIKSYNKYPGREESVHLLTEVLVGDVIKNIKK